MFKNLSLNTYWNYWSACALIYYVSLNIYKNPGIVISSKHYIIISTRTYLSLLSVTLSLLVADIRFQALIKHQYNWHLDSNKKKFENTSALLLQIMAI